MVLYRDRSVDCECTLADPLVFVVLLPVPVFNLEPLQQQQQAVYFQARRAENPYSNVPMRVNVSDYVRDYR
ncbi:hypothetical protein KA344_01665 [bacterium]|nr:hypothetical protein [bacterium]